MVLQWARLTPPFSYAAAGYSCDRCEERRLHLLNDEPNFTAIMSPGCRPTSTRGSDDQFCAHKGGIVISHCNRPATVCRPDLQEPADHSSQVTNDMPRAKDGATGQ